MTAVKLLTARDPETAKELAEELNSANQERQALSQKIFEEAERQLAKQGPPEWSLVLGEEGWHPGVIGIVASRMTEKYHLPSVLLSIDGETAKGSCRSIPPLDLYQALDRCRDHLVQFGGHAQAAGLTIRTAEIPAFREAFARVVAEMLDHKPYEPAAVPDWFVPEDREITPEAVAQLAQMEPSGGEPGTGAGVRQGPDPGGVPSGQGPQPSEVPAETGGLPVQGAAVAGGAPVPFLLSGGSGGGGLFPRVNTFRG